MIISLLLGTALAQDATGGAVPELNVQLFRPTIDGNHTLWLDDSGLGPEKKLSGRYLLQWVNDPLTYTDADGNVTALVDDVFQADVMGAYVLGPVRFGVDLPLYLRSTATDTTNGQTGLGDIALDVKGQLIDREDAPLGVAVGTRLGLPTATVDTALGAGGVSWALNAIVDQKFGPVLLAANLGTRGNPEVELENVSMNDQLFYGLGGGYELSETSGVSLELVGHASYGEMSNTSANPLEAVIGGWNRFASSGLVLRGGLGLPMNSGIGAPRSRLLLAIALEPQGPKDRDGDGLTDKADACPDSPEDLDSYEDQDGCPEPTQVIVHFVDPTGAPVPGVQVVLGEDPGTGDQKVALEPGIYPLTAKAEGFGDVSEPLQVLPGAPMEKAIILTPVILAGKLLVQVVDKEGEPVAATFKLGETEQKLADGTTTLELDPGQVAFGVTAPGYLGRRMKAQIASKETTTVRVVLEKALAMVTAEKIDIADSVYFETGKDIIKANSHALLNQIASLLKAHPELTKVRIEGHTDSRGSAAYNLSLSKKRAASVRQYLIDQGVPAGQLVSEGYGESKPLDKANNNAAWEKNRRVDFFIAERSDG